MLDSVGEYKQDFDEVRRLCLQCHGLDLTTNTLFSRSTYLNKSKNTASVLQSMLSSSLLNLAVALRINIYQSKLNGKNELLEMLVAGYYLDDEFVMKEISVKDVCDKIIHADTISKPEMPAYLMGDDVKVSIQLRGKQRNRGWTLDLCLEVFTETVLNLLDKVEMEKEKEAQDAQ